MSLGRIPTGSGVEASEDENGRSRALQKLEKELAEKSRQLRDVSTALDVLLRKWNSDQEKLRKQILSNVRVLICPCLEKLRTSGLNDGQRTLLSILENNLNEITSPFVCQLFSSDNELTPTEVRVASLIKNGKTSKEIAGMLNVSLNTVLTYRHNIRGKLGLKKKKVNLRSYLNSLEKQ